MTPVASTVALGPGVRLSCARRGDPSGPALVFFPGPTDSWWSYLPVLDRLPASIHAVAVSQRGHGDSDKPASGYGIADFASDAVALLDALGIERAVLAGHSGSGFVVRRVAIEHPDRVTGLVLEASPVTLRGERRLTEFVQSVVEALEDPIDAEFVRAFVSDTSSTDVAAEIVERAVDETCKVPARVWREMFRDLLTYDDRDDLRNLPIPAVLVWGDADDLVDRRMQTELLGLLTNAELLVYAGAGHTPRWTDPSRFAADTAGFVERWAGEPG